MKKKIEKFQIPLAKKYFLWEIFPKENIFLLKEFGIFRKNIFSSSKKYFFDDKKKVFFFDHYIALKFYEEAIFRILVAIRQVWALQIF